MNRLDILSILLVTLLLGLGCSHINTGKAAVSNTDKYEGKEEEFLQPIKMPSNAVGIEIFFIRRNINNEEATQNIWENVSELSFSDTIRRKMQLNGFQFGLLGSGQTSQLVDLLNKANPGSGAHVDAWDEMIQFNKDENVMCRYVELIPGQPAETLASDIYDDLTVLQKTEDSIGGESFKQAQCVFRIVSASRPDGAIDLSIQPEIQYGQQRQQYLYEQGSVKMEFGRNRKTYDELTMKTKLKPGEMVVMSSLPNQSATLGASFFSDSAIHGNYQKIMVLRLVRWREDPLFPKSGVKKTDIINQKIVDSEAPEQIEPIIIDADKNNSQNTENSKHNTVENNSPAAKDKATAKDETATAKDEATTKDEVAAKDKAATKDEVVTKDETATENTDTESTDEYDMRP